MIPTVYSNPTDASIYAGRMKFYYGPNQIDEDNGDWCFVGWKNGKEVIRIPNSQLLDIACGEGPKDMLLAGLAIYLNK